MCAFSCSLQTLLICLLLMCITQGSKHVFESGRQFGHLEERLVAKLSLVSKSEIP